jgi:hypothetical protein
MVGFEFPLQWLPQQLRTKRPERARFGNHSPFKAGDYLIAELQRLGAKNFVISSNLQQRARGDGFYAKQRVEDAGVVVYFDLKGKGKAMACDKWDKVEHNLWALYLSVSAIRGLERWGGSEFLDGLFTGFKALPAPDDVVIVAEKNYFEGISTKEQLLKRYKELAKELHPDMPNGNNSEFIIMSKQFQKLKEGQAQG